MRRKYARLRRPVRRRRIGSERMFASRARSAASFCEMTSSQKVATAVKLLSLPAMERMTAGSESSPPMTAVRARRCDAQAGQTSSVWSAESSLQSQWWQAGLSSLLAI